MADTTKKSSKSSHGQTLRMRSSSAPAPLASLPPPTSTVQDDLPTEVDGLPHVLPIEVKVIRDDVPERGRRPWRAVEVWTRNRLYAFDSNFSCIEVLDRSTGKPHPEHPMIGARLGGGRFQSAGQSGISYPLPLPGMEAMLVQGRRHGSTSAVDRVILRVRVVNTTDEPVQTWEDVAAQWGDSDQRSKKRR